jgi:hypothetical protein
LGGPGGAGWNAGGEIGSNSLAAAGSSRPSFLGGDGAAAASSTAGNNKGGFGGGGGGGGPAFFNELGVLAGGGGGGGGGYSGGGGGGSIGGGGGGGSYIVKGAISPVKVSGANGVPNAGGAAGANGFVIIQLLGQAGVRFDYSGTTQNYIVPTTGLYMIDAFGAQGGSSGDGNGGYGAGTVANFFLAAGTDLFVVAGEAGATGDIGGGFAGGGGGGSFVWEPFGTFQAPGPLPGAGLAGLAALGLGGLCARRRRA